MPKTNKHSFVCVEKLEEAALPVEAKFRTFQVCVLSKTRQFRTRQQHVKKAHAY